MRIALFLCLLGCLLMSAENAPAADALDHFSARTYKNEKQAVLLYRLMQPEGYQAEKKYPLVIFLHGAGERGNDNFAQLKHGMRDFASDENRKKYPAFVIAPQCPTNQKWVDVDWSKDSSTMPKEPAPSMQLTLELIAALQKEFSIDASRIYITGLSMGGYGSWDALQRHPEIFAAGAPICGGGDPAHAVKFKNVPVWAFHGDQDTAVKVNRSREMIAALKAAGATPKYTEYPGVGHDSWSATYKNPEFYTWLFEQQKGK
jgi:predicted peptidase